MATRDYRELLANREEQGLKVSIGFDPDFRLIPEVLRKSGSTRGEDILRFTTAIVDATHDLVLAYKPNPAFFVRGGQVLQGLQALRDTITYIHEVAPEVLVLYDGKFSGAIQSENLGYVDLAFDWMGADAVTVNGYAGGEALQPFLECAARGIFVLCHTSNRGAGEFQDLSIRSPDTGLSMPFYKYVATRVATKWNTNGNCGLVVNAIPSGTTWTEELIGVRGIAADLPILIPGTGAQGGDIERTVRAGANSKGQGMFINESRSIIFASHGPDFAEAARNETQKRHDQIHAVLAAAQKGG